MRAELIDFMGDDIRVANAARVSFDKESEWDQQYYIPDTSDPDEYDPLIKRILVEKDVKLLSYLAKHNHWTPFSHVMITMRETVPIFVARQRFKHVVGFTYNEISRRYVSDEPSFYTPDSWRKAAENKKQGSSDEVIDNDIGVNIGYAEFIEDCVARYNWMLEQGVAPEQARMVLPQSMYTSYYVTGSLAAWARAYKLRTDEHAQKEIQDLAHQWGDIIDGISSLENSWKALTSV